ncbi:MAG: hypothetical protein ACP5O0_09880 [Acidimicrobiales bacterium]
MGDCGGIRWSVLSVYRVACPFGSHQVSYKDAAMCAIDVRGRVGMWLRVAKALVRRFVALG